MRLTFPMCLVLALCACGNDGDRATGANARDPAAEALPSPAGTSGSVTGMPDEPGPGPAEAMPSGDALDDALVGPDGLPLPPDAVEALDPAIVDGSVVDPAADPAAFPPATGATPAPPDESGPGDAVAVVRAYYGAINAADYARAHALWAPGASGQTPDQFALGFADTASVVVDVEPPGRIEGAAGSRYIEVPVAVEARQRDGGVRRFVGAYVLRRSAVDGASEAQRQWRIASADIREVRP